MPSTTSSSVSMPLASSTVMTPSLPTFCIASAIILPISASPLAEIVPTCAVSAWVVIFLLRFFSSSTSATTALSTPRFRSIGFMPADTALPPSRTIACASTIAGGGAVAGDVVGLRGDLAHHLRAHVLELVGEFDLLGDGDAILGDARRAVAFVEDHVAALRAERDASPPRRVCRRRASCAGGHRRRTERLSQPFAYPS